MYYRNAAAAVIVVDVSNPASLQVADRWILDLRQKTEGEDCYVILAANKVDLEDRAVSHEQIEEFCSRIGIDFLETSALTGHNVKEVFETICQRCVVPEAADASQGDNVIQCRSSGEQPKRVRFLCMVCGNK